MSNVVELPSREEVYDQASLWIAKLDRQLNTEETQALKEWIASSSINREVLFKMAKLWDKMDSLSALSELFEEPAAHSQNAQKNYFPMGIAASFIILCSVLVLGVARLPGQELRDWLSGADAVASVVDGVYETGLGEQSRISLPDGSELVLNTDSLIKVKYSNDHRLLMLERGEVHIDVAHDNTRPLRVYARDKIVQAVGTAFNVEIFENEEVELIVTDGKVLISEKEDIAKQLEAIVPKRLPTDSRAVSKGEKVVIGSEAENIAKVEEAEIAANLSWRQGKLIFRGESLEDALAEISRYTSVEFELIDESIKQVRIAGLFKAGDVSGLLTALNQNFDIAYKKVGDQKVLLRAK